jgi:SAM-dependent methyltransferase
MPIISGSSEDLHRHRHVAESFGTDAARYDRTRPTYPAALVERLVSASPGRDFLDVGIGTGIAARLFQAAGRSVLGVEADARMAEFARNAGAEVEVSTMEAWDPAGRTFDAVVSGQAWHWVDPVAGAAKAAEVLRPGGVFAAFWNVHQPPAEVSAAFAEVYQQYAPELPVSRAPADLLGSYLGFCERIAQSLRATDGAFGEPETWRFEWEKTYTRAEWLDMTPTHGGHSLLPPERLDALLDALGAAIDELGGGFVVRYTTVAVTALRFPSSPARGEPHGPSAQTVAGRTDKKREHTPGSSGESRPCE